MPMRETAALRSRRYIQRRCAVDAERLRRDVSLYLDEREAEFGVLNGDVYVLIGAVVAPLSDAELVSMVEKLRRVDRARDRETMGCVSR